MYNDLRFIKSGQIYYNAISWHIHHSYMWWKKPRIFTRNSFNIYIKLKYVDDIKLSNDFYDNVFEDFKKKIKQNNVIFKCIFGFNNQECTHIQPNDKTFILEIENQFSVYESAL